MVRYTRDLADGLEAEGIEVRTIGLSQGMGKPEQLEKWSDVIHLCSPSMSNLMVLLRTKRRPIVVTLHDPKPHPGEGFRSIAVALYNRLVLRKATGIVVHGHRWVNAVQCKTSGIVRYAPLGIRPPGTEVMVFPSRPHFLFFGRVRPYKGVCAFLEAAQCLSRTYPDADFTLAGEGQIGGCMKVVDARINLVNRVIDDDEIPELFSAASVVVLPYTSATQSGVISLAYAFGRPVIATNVGALAETVIPGQTGWLVEPNNVQALTRAMQDACDLDTCKSYGMRARLYYQQYLSPEAMAKAVVDLYRTIVTCDRVQSLGG